MIFAFIGSTGIVLLIHGFVELSCIIQTFGLPWKITLNSSTSDYRVPNLFNPIVVHSFLVKAIGAATNRMSAANGAVKQRYCPNFEVPRHILHLHTQFSLSIPNKCWRTPRWPFKILGSSPNIRPFIIQYTSTLYNMCHKHALYLFARVTVLLHSFFCTKTKRSSELNNGSCLVVVVSWLPICHS